MIKCNLSVILAQRGLKVSDIAESTGISRTTLTSLYYNQGKGIQFDTLDKICSFLDIAPGDLFSRYRFEVHLLNVEKSRSAEGLFMTCEFMYEDDSFEGTVLCVLEEEDVRFRIIIWNKLYNRLYKIPRSHLAQSFIEYFEAHMDKKVDFPPEIAIYEDEVDDFMKNNLE